MLNDDPIDVVFLFRHSQNNDSEIRYSLRSIAYRLPFIRKVWIFGDRPEFLTTDESIVEHVAHGYVAPLFGYQVPVRNDFLMLFLASLIPGLSYEFLKFSDDFVILEPLARDLLCTPRALEDLNHARGRGEGAWKEQLWQTFDVLKNNDYPGFNFESHVPQPYTKKLVFEAYMTFRDFLSEERYGGLVSATTICNYAIKHHNLKYVWLPQEQSKVGFYGNCPSEREIHTACRGKLFLNFDDTAFGPPMQQYLTKQFPDPCKYERDYRPS